MLIKEWSCAQHGPFEGSHPICPEMGCDSSDVKREIRTAPATKSDATKRFDDGIRKTAEMYGQSDFKSARAGESSKANSQASQVLWGDKASRFLGRPLQQAHVPQQFNIQDREGNARVWTDKGGMATAADDIGITRSVLPPAERMVASNEKEMRKSVTK